MNAPPSSRFPLLVLASRNRKKSEEIAQLMSVHGLVLKSVADFPDVPDVVEDGDSFAANAAKKASETARRIGHWTIAEDSGLEVDALGGAPGVLSARYSGENATDEANNARLIADLAGVPDERRTARYVCHVCVSDPEGNIRLAVEGTCRGRITTQARGTNGFGYDPYFLIPEYHRTFGELDPVVKRHISHRAKAFERFIPQLVKLLAETTAS